MRMLWLFFILVLFFFVAPVPPFHAGPAPVIVEGKPLTINCPREVTCTNLRDCPACALTCAEIPDCICNPAPSVSDKTYDADLYDAPLQIGPHSYSDLNSAPPKQGRWLFAGSALYLSDWGVGAGLGYRWPNGVTLIGQALYGGQEGCDETHLAHDSAPRVVSDHGRAWGGAATVLIPLGGGK